MTAPQPATPGSDSVRAQIAEALQLRYAAKFVLPLVDRLRTEAKAEALEQAADDWDLRGLTLTACDLRDRAAAYRTNPSSEETHRGE